MAATEPLEWIGRDVAVSEIAAALSRLRARSQASPLLRTSVMTHVAWVPPAWVDAALETLAGLEERHPSRTIVLLPDPDGDDRIDAKAALRGFALDGQDRQVSTEVVKIWLRGERAYAPASVVEPLLVSDLPVFLRWRGEPPWGADELDQLVGVADRLVVDTGEWEHLPRAYGRLAGLFERVAVSDIAWSRTLPWRRALAVRWPAIAELRELQVRAPKSEALLLAGWLRARLAREVRLVHEQADGLERLAVDGEDAAGPGEPRDPSDLLSDQLDIFGRDPIYEEAVQAAR